MNKDQLINDIITAIISNTFYDWKQYNLTLIDEALIQYRLRQHNIEIKRRLHRKISNKSINKIRYEILAGADWPSWEEYVNGAAVEELDPNGLGITGKNDLDDWYYIMPVNTKNMFEIKFEDIVSTGYGFVDGLAHFLNVTEFDKPKIYAIIDEYRSNQ